MFEYDLLILGGGPAGLSTALHLAQIEPDFCARVAILEKAHYPRPKLCAGGLTRDAERILERLGLNTEEVPHVDVPMVRFRFEDAVLTFSIPGGHGLRVVRRNVFDAWLAEKARQRGLQIHEGVQVQDVHPEKDAVTVIAEGETWRAKVVIGADGANSVTRRAIFPLRPIATARTLETLVPCDLEIHPATEWAEFDLSCLAQGIAGYVWDFPTQVDGRAMHCWGVYDTNLLAGFSRPPLRQVLREALKRDFELQSYPIRYFVPWQPLSRPRVLLVGDAAGVDGLLGEGIGVALGYGMIAAETIKDAFKRGDFSFEEYRRRLFSSGLGRMLLFRWALAQVLYRLPWPPLQRFLWGRLSPLILWMAQHGVINWAAKR